MKYSALLLALSPLAATGQSTIAPGQPFVHATNFGWINFRPSAADGLVVDESTLSGYVWSTNLGWIHFGNGQTHNYLNTTAGNYGVNLAPDGRLTGYAWCPNAGWIVFEQVHGKPRIDLLTGKFAGSAYCPNVGWIIMDTVQDALRTTTVTIADTDHDGLGDAWEMQQFQNLTSANATSNADRDAASDLEEYRAGTLPNNNADSLQILSHALTQQGNSITIRFTASPSRMYRLEFCDDWTLPDFTSSALFAPDQGPVTERTFAITPASRLFFRIVAIRPLVP